MVEHHIDAVGDDFGECHRCVYRSADHATPVRCRNCEADNICAFCYVFELALTSIFWNIYFVKKGLRT